MFYFTNKCVKLYLDIKYQIGKLVEFDAFNLDLIKRDTDFAITYQEKILKTPGLNDFAVNNQNLLHAIVRDLLIVNGFNTKSINLYNLYIFHKDRIECKDDQFFSHFSLLFKNDPVIQKKIKFITVESSENTNELLNFYENLKINNLFSYSGSIQLLNAFTDLMYELDGEISKINIHNLQSVIDIFEIYYKKLRNSQKVIINILSSSHLSGFLAPLLLASNRISLSEYVNAVFNIHSPNFSINHKDITRKIAMHYGIESDLPDWNSIADSYNRIYKSTAKCLEYHSYFKEQENYEVDLKTIILKGESHNLEFKSTLRMNLAIMKKDPNIEHSSLKTIAAFLNTSGGTLLIGVRDDGSLEGIETDEFENTDKFLLHLWNLIKSSLGKEITAFIHAVFQVIDKKTACSIICERSTKPVFLRQKNFGEEFYIRIGPSSAKLEISEALEYISERFK
jgi:hypothetical protein